MPHYLFRLKFTAPVHFGSDIPGVGLEKSEMSCHADTLFSALCHEILMIYGKDKLYEFVELAKTGRVLISDMMPYSGEELLLPKPVIYVERDERKQETPSNNPSLKKVMKSISHVPVTGFNDYIKFLKSGSKLPFMEGSFGAEERYWKVAVSGYEKPMPYMVGGFTFNSGCGLYFIVYVENDIYVNTIKSALKSLGLSGIGGKRTSGFGRFEQADDEICLSDKGLRYESEKVLAQMLERKAKWYMSLSVICPSSKDLENICLEESYYTLVQRKGFIQSRSCKKPVKRKPLVMFNAGSCFQNKLEGAVKDVAGYTGHSVFRYGKGLFIGVEA